MGPYARINVNPGYIIKFLNLAIESFCGIMWDGIYMYSAPNINTIESTSISDAINGLVFTDGAQFNIDASSLSDNFYNVKVITDSLNTQTFIPYPGSITNTTFTGTNYLLLGKKINKKCFNL